LANKTILVTGANGQLGSEIRRLSPAHLNFDFLFVTKEDLPIDDHAAVENYFDAHSISYCINCAAYTAVDKAETERDLAFRINGEAVGNLAAVCKKHQTVFIHISTDYVFDGSATQPYKEDHPVNPVNLYGASKLKGEQLAMHYNKDAVIIRTSWVYSSYGHNFVKTMLRLMTERERIDVVSDQLGCPTYAADLAAVVLQIVLKYEAGHATKNFHLSNIYHYSDEGITSWYEFAQTIKELAGKKCAIHPIPTSQFPTPAKRPLYSVMDTSKIREVFDLNIPFWKDSLQKCIGELQAKSGL
jgi:dTDP-4-dehydrorhamnose reductase